MIVYDLSDDVNQLEEGLWAANALHDYYPFLEKEKVFILLGSVMIWARTKPTDPVSLLR